MGILIDTCGHMFSHCRVYTCPTSTMDESEEGVAPVTGKVVDPTAIAECKVVENHAPVPGERTSTPCGSPSSQTQRDSEAQVTSKEVSSSAMERTKGCQDQSSVRDTASQGVEERLQSAASNAESSTSDSSETLPTYQPKGSAQYQLVFGMDDESSETSFPGSPKSLDTPSKALPGYVLSESCDLPHTISESSHDLGGDIVSLGQDSADPSGTSSSLDDTLKGPEDEASSVYSGSTLVAESIEPGGSSSVGQLGDTSATEGGGSSPDSKSEVVNLEDVQIQSRSSSKTPSPQPKIHALSQYASDSEVPPTPPYSPMEYHSGDEDGDETYGNVAIVSRSPLPGGIASPIVPMDDHPSMSILFSGVIYLGSSSVDAPISETEANRKMFILKQQAATTEPIPVVLSIPTTNEGTVYLKDPESDQPLTTFPVKMILFCARGSTENLFDCFCLNVRHKRSGIYHCHVFRCEILEAVSHSCC